MLYQYVVIHLFNIVLSLYFLPILFGTLVFRLSVFYVFFLFVLSFQIDANFIAFKSLV